MVLRGTRCLDAHGRNFLVFDEFVEGRNILRKDGIQYLELAIDAGVTILGLIQGLFHAGQLRGQRFGLGNRFLVLYTRRQFLHLLADGTNIDDGLTSLSQLIPDLGFHR